MTTSPASSGAESEGSGSGSPSTAAISPASPTEKMPVSSPVTSIVPMQPL